jgi:O-antigen/teichoic acid export membrane protein
MLLVSSVGQLAISLATIALVGRWLSPPAFALFGLIGALFSIARDLLDMGSTAVATRLLAANPERSTAIIGAAMVWRAMLAAIAAGGVWLAGMTLAAPGERAIVLAAGLALCSSICGAFNALFTARHRQTTPAIASIVVQGGALVVLLILRASGAPEHAAAWTLVVREIAWWLVVLLLGLRLLAGAPVRPRRMDDLRPVVGPGIVFGAAVVLHQVLVQGDVPLARWVLGEHAAAWVAASARPIGAMVALPWIAAGPLIAAVAALSCRGAAEDQSLRRSAVVLGLMTGFGVAALGASAAPSILQVLYGERYASDPTPVLACRAYCIVLGGAVAASAPTMLLVGLHRERTLLAIAGICVLGACIGKWAAAREQDVGLMTLVTAGAEWALAIAASVACLRRVGLPMLSAGALFSVAPVAAGCITVWAVGGRSIVPLAAALGFGIVHLALVARSREAGEYRRACLLAGSTGGGA